MPDRIEIKELTYMNVGGQPTLVDKGTVLDVPDGSKFHGSQATPVAETAGALKNALHSQVVRNGRFR